MLGQVSHAGKEIAAFRALYTLLARVSIRMDHFAGARRKRLVANLTLILADRRMELDVSPQFVTFDKRLRANGALEPAANQLLLVPSHMLSP